MSDVCASGGYYISMPADTLIASSGSIVGSIGVFGLLPELSGLLTTLIYDGVGPTDICFEDVFVSDSNAESLGTGISDCVLLDIIAFPGDTNLDELINVQDIVVIINFILGFSNPSEQQHNYQYTTLGRVR